METLAAINRWLAKQHVVTGAYIARAKCGAPTPYYDPERVAFTS